MKFFRTHIARSFNVGILLAGLVFYFMKPVSDSAENDAFAVWLQSNLKSSSSTIVVDQIRGLSAADGKLESVIREASALVKANADDFELPVNSQSQDENEVFQLLLKEWNAYQSSSSGMGKAVLIKQAQPNSVLPVDGFSFGNKSATHQQNIIIADAGISMEQIHAPTHRFYLSPLSSGTAINAP
ncbi:MAG TPA: hypothetical protein VFM80_01280 [Gracilimonas sp.]|uniref:hypothetical protein n=1 Tax=Gracilimonas sp. TaxID=1974203 RepID=UPI002D951023|nr:hypothetical protein [Gracilimonas sp.]